MNSLIGRNAVFCTLRYDISLNQNFSPSGKLHHSSFFPNQTLWQYSDGDLLTNFKPKYFRQLFYAQLNSDAARADNAYEIILIREKVLSLPNFLIERTDFASLLDVLLRPS